MKNEIKAEALRDLLDRGESATVLDIRHRADYEEWTIPGSIHLDAYDALWRNDPDALASLDPPERLPVVAICAMGKTSAIAARHLNRRGIDALTLKGGMRAWSLAWNTAEVATSIPGVEVVQVRRTGKGCLSYMIASAGEAMVLDASVETEVYTKIAEERGWSITRVIDSHVHADHLSRSRMLAKQSGATLYFPEQERVSYDHAVVHNGDLIEFGEAKLAAYGTPGHTPESMSFLLNESLLFTGDTLFLDGVGRPDLGSDEEETRAKASDLHRTLSELGALGPATIVLPGHTGRPVAFDGEPLSSPLEAIFERVDMLGMSEDEFVGSLLGRIPTTPRNHLRIIELNEAGMLPASEQTDLEAGANRCGIS